MNKTEAQVFISKIIKGSSSSKYVTEIDILAKCPSKSDSSIVREVLSDLRRENHVGWCFIERRKQKMMVYWEPGMPRFAPYSYGRAYQSSRNGFSI